MNDISSAKSKLEHARFHIERADAISKDFVERGFYTPSKHEEPDDWHSIRVATLADWPAEFALAVGDAAHNLRAVLDHIVFALAEKPLTSEEERKLQFPLMSDPEDFASNGVKQLKGVPQRAVDLIETYQPYRAGQRPENILLAQLQTVDNWDKHRALAITYSRVKRTNFRPIVGDGKVANICQFSGRLELGAVLTRFKLNQGVSRDEVEMKGEVVVVPNFDAPMPENVQGLSIVTFLYNAWKLIASSVIPAFANV
jgi:hypothetical protein